MHPCELLSHVGSDLFHHRLKLGLAPQRLQTQIIVKVVPPQASPALIDGLSQGGQCLFGLTLLRIDLGIGDSISIFAEPGNPSNDIPGTVQQHLRTHRLVG